MQAKKKKKKKTHAVVEHDGIFLGTVHKYLLGGLMQMINEQFKARNKCL